VPLPQHVADVVVALPAQRLTDLWVLVAVAGQAVQRSAVGADRAVAPCSAGTSAAATVDRSERRRREGGEGGRMSRHSVGDGLAAGQAADQEVPGVALVLSRARRTHGGSAVLTPDVGVPVQLFRRPV
jgi:hypothetical protein